MAIESYVTKAKLNHDNLIEHLPLELLKEHLKKSLNQIEAQSLKDLNASRNQVALSKTRLMEMEGKATSY